MLINWEVKIIALKISPSGMSKFIDVIDGSWKICEYGGGSVENNSFGDAYVDEERNIWLDGVVKDIGWAVINGKFEGFGGNGYVEMDWFAPLNDKRPKLPAGLRYALLIFVLKF